jgi:potassium efflux system protein
MMTRMLKNWSDWRARAVRCSFISMAIIALALCARVSGAQDAPSSDTAQQPADRAQPGAEPATPQPEASTPKAIQDQITALEQAGELDEKGRAALDVLRRALVAAQQADEFAAKVLEYQQIVQGVPERLKEFEARAAEPIKEPAIDPAGMTTEQIRHELSAAQSALETAKQSRQMTEQETAQRTQRREQIPPEIAALRRELGDVEQRLLAPINGSEDPILAKAQRTKLQADKRRLQQQITMLEEELRSYDARRDTLRLRRQVSERDAQEADKLVQAWQAAMSAREQQEAARLAQQAKEAQQQAESVHPLVADMAETNRDYARERTELVPRLEQAMVELKNVDSTLQRLRDDLHSVRTRVDRSGTTTTIGLLLRNKRSSLPRVADLERKLREWQAEISRVQLLRSDLDDELLNLVNIEDRVEASLEARDDIPEAERERIKAAAIEQLRRRKEEFIPGLIISLDAYLEDTLVRLDQAATELIDVLEEYHAYVDERILWIRSANPVSLETASGIVEAGRWMLSGRHWRGVLEGLWRDAKENWASVAPSLLFILVLAAVQRPARKRIDQIAVEIRSFRTDTLGRTFAALGLTALKVVFVPAILWFLSARLTAASDVIEGDAAVLARAAAEGLSRAAVFLLVSLTLWYVCMPRGLAEAHFRWRVASLKLLRRNLFWLIPVMAPGVFVVAMLEHQANESFKASLGRAGLMVISVSLAVFLARVLRPNGGILHGYLGRKAGGWIDRLRFVWYPAAVGVPIVLGLASLAGYHYTAVQLGRTVNKTTALIIGATILHALLVRWLLVAQRKLAMEQARKRREAQADVARTASESAGPAAASAEPGSRPAAQTQGEIAIDVPELDISAIGEQSRRLMLLGVWFALVLGLWAAWFDVLPALGALRQVELTQQVQTVTETVADEDGVAVVRTFDRIVALTLADVLLAILVVVLTVVAVRNIPGLLEITILQRLPLPPSGRYAVLTICKYIFMIVGIVLAFSMVGVGWSKVQWLAAAITVGLGFGLQEIFANFVSGIIILFEQPIRVGDVVTINDISGTVTRIRMRATTIRDWDRKELIIPNKSFVTDRIINWTLSDTVLRLRIPVGIAYGSDTTCARDEMLQVARAHPHVLRDPEPQAWFDNFGDSTLNFELRVFIGSTDHLLLVRHDLLSGVDQAFRKAGIEIAFPQRDLHIRSGLEAIMPRNDGEEAKAPASQ